MFKTNCSCTGEEQTTVFVRPETCGDNFHTHHNHNTRNEEVACSSDDCHECTEHPKSCGCESPQIFFFKLKDKIIDDEINFVAAVSELQLSVASKDLLYSNSEPVAGFEVSDPYSDPPPKITSSLDFLISIRQLKIPSLAS